MGAGGLDLNTYRVSPDSLAGTLVQELIDPARLECDFEIETREALLLSEVHFRLMVLFAR